MSERSRIGWLVPRRVRTTASTVLAVVTLVRDRNITYMAAGLAYYAFVSMLPILLLTVAAASFVGGETLALRVSGTLSQQLSSSGQQLVVELLTDTAGRGAASVVGFFALLWSALKLFRGLDQAFGELYPSEATPSLLARVWEAIVVVSGIASAGTLIVAVAIALSTLRFEIPFVNVVGTLLLSVVLALVLLPIYYVLPPIDVSLREVLPGAVVAAVGWVLLQVVFRLYAFNANRYGAYGLLGAALLFVTWLYFASVVVLVGASANAVLQGATVDSS